MRVRKIRPRKYCGEKIIIPCEIGDTLYFESNQGIVELIVTGIYYSETVNGSDGYIYAMVKDSILDDCLKYRFEDVGSKIFLK